MNPYKESSPATRSRRTLADALKDADLFLGLSGANLLKPEWLKTMAKNPIVFAMANPNPEITYPEAIAARKDVIIATGRSDYPNQVNNVLGFPFIFRGALDCRATTINEEMKLAAAHALADLAKEDVPDKVSRAYRTRYFHFGREYLIPKPFDYRVLLWEAAAVAKAAMETGVAQKPLDLEEYRYRLEKLLGRSRELMRGIINRAQAVPEADRLRGRGERPHHPRDRHGARGEARPAGPSGPPGADHGDVREARPRSGNTEIVDIEHDPRLESYVQEYYRLRHRKGITMDGARNGHEEPERLRLDDGASWETRTGWFPGSRTGTRRRSDPPSRSSRCAMGCTG